MVTKGGVFCQGVIGDDLLYRNFIRDRNRTRNLNHNPDRLKIIIKERL
jgi:hypothetical protein